MGQGCNGTERDGFDPVAFERQDELDDPGYLEALMDRGFEFLEWGDWRNGRRCSRYY